MILYINFYIYIYEILKIFSMFILFKRIQEFCDNNLAYLIDIGFDFEISEYSMITMDYMRHALK
jgi:hypothetical protein